MKRSQVRPLFTADAIHAVLSGLQVGDLVPVDIFICDYVDDEIPCWKVAEREECAMLVSFTLVDVTTYHLRILEGTYQFVECWVACDVMSCQTKVLAGPLYTYYAGCEHARNMLADIRQHARQMAERRFGVERVWK
jgi:hypothetical protein